jgi:hypothetical protein
VERKPVLSTPDWLSSQRIKAGVCLYVDQAHVNDGGEVIGVQAMEFAK